MTPIFRSISPSISPLLNPYNVMNLTPFLNEFGHYSATMIACGEHISSKDQSVTSFNMKSSISLFAIEKEGDKNTAVLCWHIKENTLEGDLVKEPGIEAYPGELGVCCFEFDKTYDFYIIGGKEDTTEEPD